ncbi:MAG: chorismate synthase [Tepidisphaerales bacterium]
MAQLAYRTAGESHGKALIALVEGMPAGVAVDVELINGELRRRQGGYGRGGRQKIETDVVELLSGVRQGHTIGSPVAMMLVNRDARLDDPDRTPPLFQPRPGHADLAGSVKYLTTDCRETLERASARETAARVMAGALAKCLLAAFGIEVFGFVRQVGEVRAKVPALDDGEAAARGDVDVSALRAARDASECYVPDAAADAAFVEFIHRAKVNKDTAGGVVECHVFNLPVGLGSCMTWDGRLDGRIAAAVVGIQAFKGVEFGLGFEAARRFGSQVHDEIVYDPSRRQRPSLGFVRPTNHAGGLEGGMTNGAPLVVRGAMKPISTLGKPLRSVDLNTKQPTSAGWERSDISAISAASVVMECVVAFEVARALREKFGGDSLTEMKRQYEAYLEMARSLPLSGDAPTGA